MEFRFMFMHIPKTAGTSFGGMLRDIFGEEAIYPFIDNDGFEGSIDDLERYKVFQGHINYFVWRLLPQPIEIVTLLREPVKRAISIYKHIKFDPEHPDHEILCREAPSLAEFARHEYLQGHIYNLQTAKIGQRLRFAFDSRSLINEPAPSIIRAW